MSRQSARRREQPRLKAAVDYERVVCRVVAAWCSFAAAQLFRKGSFANLSFAQTVSWAEAFWIILLFLAIYTAVAAFLPRFETDSWFLLGAATLCVSVWLLRYDWSQTNGFLMLLAIILAYCLFLVYFIRRNAALLDRFQPGRRGTWIVAAVCGAAAGGVIAYITCLRYLTFSAPNYDFGLFCQMFRYMRKTGLPLVTAERDRLLTHFAVHASPIYYLLLPFYLLFPSPLTLQIGQAAVLASGVVPTLLLARHFKLSGKAQILLPALYAFYTAISGGCFYDIHENCFLTPLLLWMFLFFEREKYPLMYLFALGVLMVKEDAAVYLIVFALFLLFSRKKYLHGALLAAAAIGYFSIVTFLLTKYGEGVMVNRFNNLIFDRKDGLLGAVKTAIVNPGFLLTQLFRTSKDNWDKVVYFLQLFLPLGFLPFCTRKTGRWILLTPVLMNLLTTYQYQYHIGFQYSFGITAFLFYAVIQNLPDLQPPTRRTLSAIAAVSCLCLYAATVLPKADRYAGQWRRNRETYREMERILDTLPRDASLNVSTFLLAHVSDHAKLYELDYHKDAPDVDYVVIDARYMDKKATAHRDRYLAQHYTIPEEHKDHANLILILRKPAAASP